MRDREHIDSTQLSVRVPIEYVQQLEKRARAADRSFSAEVRRAIRLHIEKKEDET